MGGGNTKPTVTPARINAFKEACAWYTSKGQIQDSELADYLAQNISKIDSIGDEHDRGLLIENAEAFGKSSDVREPAMVDLSEPVCTESHSLSDASTEYFEDCTYDHEWICKDDADKLFCHLMEIGKETRNVSKSGQGTMKYPLWTLYYGLERRKDGALALDRWGSYHESWYRVQKPTEKLVEIAQKVRRYFDLPDEAVNSIVVNYYWNGDQTYIPAHRDTVACLEEKSKVYCLSLGASRDFVLCDNNDSGKYVKSDLRIAKEWRVGHGDLFALGQDTNRRYCHAVPQERALHEARISIIFRSVSKSFISFDTVERNVLYASGRTLNFKAECIKTCGYEDEGTREHIADLIARREEKKMIKLKANSHTVATTKLIDSEELPKYYMGEGLEVLKYE